MPVRGLELIKLDLLLAAFNPVHEGLMSDDVQLNYISGWCKAKLQHCSGELSPLNQLGAK